MRRRSRFRMVPGNKVVPSAFEQARGADRRFVKLEDPFRRGGRAAGAAALGWLKRPAPERRVWHCQNPTKVAIFILP
jgi:hypothetical protein